MLELENVTKQFGGAQVLRGVSCTLAAPGVVGLIGDNGAGKTTLLRIAAGIIRPCAGTVRLFGAQAGRDRSAAARRMGALLERPGHYDEQTVRQNLTYFYGFYDTDVAAPVRRQMDRYGLAQVAERRVGELSLGYRQRLAIARAAHPWAELLLLDEPFDGLDPRARSDIKARLAELRSEQRMVLFSSHNLADVHQICDSILLLAAGRLHAFRNFDQIRQAAGTGAGADLDLVYARLATRLAEAA